MIISADILEKVERKEKENNYLKRCLAVRICPNCGETLTYAFYDDGGENHTCSSCNFIHNT